MREKVGSCVFAHVHSEHGAQFDFGSDVTTLEGWLKKLATIVNHLHPSSSSLRNYFVELASVFKGFWVLQGEGDKSGIHVDVIRKVLRAPASRVAQVLFEKEQKLRAKLSDKFFESWEDIERICREMYERGMGPGPDRSDMMCLLLSLILSAGARKTA